MTEDEAIDMLISALSIKELPEKYQSKEFIIEIVDMLFCIVDLKTIDGLVFDYEIALAYECEWCKAFKHILPLQTFKGIYSNYLTECEIEKLYTTLRLIS